MAGLIHLKDRFGNDLYFGDTGQIRMPAMPNMDFKALLKTVSDVTLREDDIIVVGYPKSGNTWTHHMVCMLKAGTTDLPPMYSNNDYYFLDTMGSDQQLPPPDDKPRVFYTHLPFRFLPREVTAKKVKVVYVTRNTKDLIVSLYCYVKNLKFPKTYPGTWPQFFALMLEQEYWYGHVLDYLMDWQTEIEAHPHHPIFHCSYEDTKRDTLRQVEKLNQFLDTGRDKQLCQEIVHTCRFENMTKTRRQNEKCLYDVWQWKDDVSPSAFYRKSVVGDWKNWFTVAQNEEFDDVYNSKMADYKHKFQYE